MQSSSESFWSEIKRYEDRLQCDPASYCFAPLADVYLKAGMLDDALAVAKAGTARYPGYVAGQMALAQVCHRKGLLEECRVALEMVTAAVPEHAEAQRMLAGLYRESGRTHDAVRALQNLLDLCPGDRSAAAELEELTTMLQMSEDDDLELIEFTEADIVDDESVFEDQLVERIKPPVALVEDPWASISLQPVEPVRAPVDDAAIWAVAEQQVAADAATSTALNTVWSVPEQEAAIALESSVGSTDPLTTPTLAELYVAQGFPEKAVEIYQRILAADPQNSDVQLRLSELEQSIQAGSQDAVFAEPSPAVVQSVDLPVAGTADKPAAVAVLEGWLENIRRLRTCH